jgi:hypothetical protein
MDANSRVFCPENNGESPSSSLPTRSITVWFLVLRLCKRTNERLNNHEWRRVDRDLGDCSWRPLWIGVLEWMSILEWVIEHEREYN